MVHGRKLVGSQVTIGSPAKNEGEQTAAKDETQKRLNPSLLGCFLAIGVDCC